MNKQDLYDGWASLAETTHDQLCEAELQGDWQKAKALKSLFELCFWSGVNLGKELL